MSLLFVLTGLLFQAPFTADSYRACASITEDAERLACFDRTAEADPALRVAGEVSAAPAPPGLAAPARAANAERRAADAEARARAAEEELARAQAASRKTPNENPDTYEAAVTSLRFKPRGELVVTLDNGETWEQLSSDSNRIRERDAAEVRSARLEKGFLGNWWLEIEPLGERIRARRRD